MYVIMNFKDTFLWKRWVYWHFIELNIVNVMSSYEDARLQKA